MKPPFSIERALSGDEYLAVTIADLGTVVIKAEPDGIVVDIYPVGCNSEPVASTWAHISDLHDEDEGGQP